MRVVQKQRHPCTAVFAVSRPFPHPQTEGGHRRKRTDIIPFPLISFGNQNEVYSKGQNMGKLIDDPTLVEVGQKYNKNGAQVALAWGIAQGHSVLPKSKTPSRIKDNLEGDFRLEKADLEKLKGVDKQMRFNDPSANFGWNFYIGEDGKVA